jgi:hypothetical protein
MSNRGIAVFVDLTDLGQRVHYGKTVTFEYQVKVFILFF